MSMQTNVHPAQESPRRNGWLWIVGTILVILVCGGLAAPGGARSVGAQGTTPTYTPPTPAACMFIAYAYVTETTVVVGANNNTARTAGLRTATLTWPAALGGTGGDYVDYFRWNGNQFYNGNDSTPPTSSGAPNSATYQIAPGVTGEFVAGFGLIPLNRPLYGSFTVTLVFRFTGFPDCTIAITVIRTSACPIITASAYSNPNVNYTVYNSTGAPLSLASADYFWPDIPNRYVNYLSWAGTIFYPTDTYDPPILNAVDGTPDTVNAFQTATFTARFGNPGTMIGGYTATLRFSNGCSLTYTHWIGITPTSTPTPTPTATRTVIPLRGASSVRFAAILLNAPDFGLQAQTIRGNVLGGGGPPYTVSISVEDPDGTIATYGQNVEADGTFELTPLEADPLHPYLGCDKEGIWEAWFVVTDRVGGTAESSHITWAVNFPHAHGIP